MSDNFFESQLNPAKNTADLSSTAANAWGPGEKLNVVKKEIIGNGKPNTGTYSAYSVHDWTINDSGSNNITLKQDDGMPIAVRKDDLGTDQLGNQIIGISFKTTGNDPSEVRMVLHKDANGQFLGVEDEIHFNAQDGRQNGYEREIIAGSRDDSALQANLKGLSEPTNPEHKFLLYKLGELNNKLGPVDAPKTTQQNLEQMLNTVEQGPYQTSNQPSSNYQNSRPIDVPVSGQTMPQYQGNNNYYPVQPGNYSYQGNYQNYPTNDQVINQQQNNGYAQNRPGFAPVTQQQYNGYRNGRPIQESVPNYNRPTGNNLLNNVVNMLAPGGVMRGRNTRDGSFYNHIGTGSFGGRNTHDGSSYMHIPLNGGGYNDNAFRKPFRPIQNRPEPVQELPPRQTPTEYVPVTPPVVRAPETTPGSAESGNGYSTKTDLNGYLFPYKKK